VSGLGPQVYRWGCRGQSLRYLHWRRRGPCREMRSQGWCRCVEGDGGMGRGGRVRRGPRGGGGGQKGCRRPLTGCATACGLQIAERLLREIPTTHLRFVRRERNTESERASEQREMVTDARPLYPKHHPLVTWRTRQPHTPYRQTATPSTCDFVGLRPQLSRASSVEEDKGAQRHVGFGFARGEAT
jgi:hypothetical protein